MAKKRINVYVDEPLYKELKGVVEVTGDTITAIFEEAVRTYIQTYRELVASGKDGVIGYFENRSKLELEELKKALNK